MPGVATNPQARGGVLAQGMEDFVPADADRLRRRWLKRRRLEFVRAHVGVAKGGEYDLHSSARSALLN